MEHLTASEECAQCDQSINIGQVPSARPDRRGLGAWVQLAVNEDDDEFESDFAIESTN